MRSTHLFAGIFVATLPALALATGGPAPAVVPGDTASMSLIMMDSGADSRPMNAGGDFIVQRSSNFLDIGQNFNTAGHIQALWNEVAQGSQLSIMAIFRTSDGSQFMPQGSTIQGGQPAVFWTWHLGVTDPINFQSWVTSVHVDSAHVFFSADSGQTFTGSVDFTNILPQNWDPGVDQGLTLSSIGDGTNYMLLDYQITAVPAPAGLGALAAGSLLAFRRRR
jgi:hypothetical protein